MVPQAYHALFTDLIANIDFFLKVHDILQHGAILAHLYVRTDIVLVGQQIAAMQQSGLIRGQRLYRS